MPFLTIAGENKLAQNQSVNGGLTVVSFVLANIPDLGAEPADRIAALPDPSLIVDTLPFTKRGYVNPNQVVYSLVMGSNIGDYDFNWIGLVDDDGVLVAVSHIPTIQKRKNVGGIPGNTITRNFLLKYTGIQEITATTVPVETWQIDFSDRLNGIDERERLANLDIYGHEGFLDDGWKVTGSAGTYSVTAGIGYVGGIRAKNVAPHEVITSTFPNEIWLNVSLQGDISDMASVAEFVIDTGPFSDYVDGNGVAHYLTKIADIDAAGEVNDGRLTYENLTQHEDKEDPHTQYFKTESAGTSATRDLQVSPLDDSEGKVLTTDSGLIDFIKTQGRKNLLVNGIPRIWQRGESFSDSGYTADRWYCELTDTTCLRDVDPNKGMHLTVNADGGYGELSQFLEQALVKFVRGETLTVSFEVAVNSVFLDDLKIEVFYSSVSDARSDVIDSIAEVVFTPNQSNSVVIALTFDVPIDAVGLCVMLSPTSTQLAGSKLWMYGAQLEIGKKNTVFDVVDETSEFLKCCRYYQTWHVLTDCYGNQNSQTRTTYTYYVPMRVTPSGTIATTGTTTAKNLNMQSVTKKDFIFGSLASNTGHNTMEANGALDAEIY
jgi:hypothetical protein